MKHYDITFHVREVHQTSGAFEHVVIFDAHLLLALGDPSIEVYFAGPYDDCVGLTEVEAQQWTLEAFESIREGVIEVLTRHNFGAICEISKLRLHPIDFHERFFKRYTVKHLEKALLNAVS